MVEQSNQARKDSQTAAPLGFFDSFLFHIYEAGLEFRGMSNFYKVWQANEFRVTDIEARRHLKRFFDEVQKGLTNARPLPAERERVFREFPAETEGARNLPKTGSFIIASNHYNKGRLRGIWQMPVMTSEIAKNIDAGFERRYRFIMENKKRYFKDLESFLMPFLHKYSPSFLEKAVQSGLDFAQEKERNISGRIMINFATATDSILVETGTRQIIEALKNGDIIGLFPSGEEELELKSVKPEAARLCSIVGKRGILTVPIGAWFDDKERIYRVNIGEPCIYNKQGTDELGYSIATLLPQKMRGCYS